jgi:broad specificity phosphatase PhoE
VKKGTLVILRHGQTDYNKQHLNTGLRDIPLNATGEAQADAVGALIKTPRFDKVYSSPLSRAFNTVARALKASGTQSQLQNADGSWQIEKRREIIELDAGDFTGRNNVTDPEVAKPYIYDVPVPNGDSIKDIVDLARELYETEIQPRLERGEKVLIGCHYFNLMAFEIVLGIREIPTGDGVKAKIPNASPLVCDFEDGVLKNHRYIQNPKTAANQNVPPAQKNLKP